jgi:glycosyltransferase involved in cell wall biosynthesis
MQKLRIHIYSPANTITSINDRRFVSCPYTTKVYNMCKMFHNNGHEVIHYGVEGSNPPCTENVEYIPYEVWERVHGSKSIERDYEQLGMSYETYQWAEKHLYDELSKRVNPKTDVILNSIGWFSKSLDKINELGAHIEYGIGHPGAGAPFQVFESYAYQNYNYSKKEHFDKKWVGAVIPGYIDEEYYYYDPAATVNIEEPYLLALGRVIGNKGIPLAAQIAEKNNIKLKVAGHGNIDMLKSYGNNVEYLGVLNLEEKIEAIRKATALMSLTYYLEPFANSHAEALMLGTPVIGTDWGVYTETIEEGVNGVRVRFWNDAIASIDRVKNLDRRIIAKKAYDVFSLKVIYPQFNQYFEQSINIFNNGWYS